MQRPISYCSALAAALAIAGTAGALTPSLYWRDYWSPASTGQDGGPLPVGSLVQAFDPNGVECGRSVTHAPGQYGYLHVYGDDPLTPEDEGADPGDVIRFTVNGNACVAIPSPVWEGGDKLQYRVDIHQSDGFLVSGSVRYAGGWPIRGTQFSISGPSAIATFTSGADGTFRAGPFAPGTHRVGLDAMDAAAFPGAVTAYDAALVLRSVIYGLPDTVPFAVSDVTGDGVVTALDASHILQFVVGLRTTFGRGRTVIDLPDSSDISGVVGESVVATFMVQAVGDVTANWRPAAPVARLASASARLVVSSGQDGASWSINSTEPVYAVDLVVTGGNAEPVFPQGWMVESHVTGDRIAIAAIGLDPLPPGYTVLVASFSAGIDVFGTANEGMALRIVRPDPPRAFGTTIAPNPFNPSTSIHFYVPERTHVRLAVFSVTGQLVRILADEPRDMGRHTVTWDGRDMVGFCLASGTYIVQLDVGSERISRRVVLSR
jgi:hypothetical protein